MVSSWGLAQNAHFWDGIETFDGPTDKNPLLAAQIDYYFDQLVSPLPDSITLEISRLITRIDSNKDLRDFFLWKLLDKYQHPSYMTQDQVFVFLFDQYFSQLDIKDLNEINRAIIQEKADQLRKLTLFKTAPDFQLNDSLDLHSVESEYTVLFFYDHDCEVCHQEMQDLDSVVIVHPEITVLSIDMNTNDVSKDILYNLYDIETTPLIYVLDREKHIIAKKIQAKQIPIILKAQTTE